ncbi:hypothetical protein BCR44DRAFT_1044792 [Catenaria anguillulae PL171]|uniref:Uncharacterized protein n=1 Tax=Catenaria anguillulae PL171 TaxID=765915 RepID=A0A1Y2HS15_9FUNG|nr:hypothetical protein BCR44DRAFT_1044792 [Catenaria anguillulae PL171]
MPHATQLNMERDMDASYYSVATAEPEHTVRFTVELHYFLNRELDLKGRKKVNKSTVDIKDKITQQQQLHGTPARQAQHVHDTGGGSHSHAHASGIDHSVGSVVDSIPRYYVTYSIGSACEGRSEVLHPSSSFWSSMHEIDVSLEFLADLYEGPIEFKIFQIKKVWSDDPNEVKEANGGPDNKLGHALSKQTLLFRRASINAIAKRLVTLSRTEALSPKTRRKIDSFRTYVLNNYKQLPVAVKVVAPTFPPPKPSTAESVKVPMAPHLAGSTNPRAALIKESANSSRASSAGSRKSVGATANNDVPGDNLGSNHPARPSISIGAANGGATSLMSSVNGPASQHHPPTKQAAHRPSKSTINAAEDLTSICSFVRPKTPPQPHHFDEPERTLPIVADLPRRHKVLIDKHIHVGSIWVDPSFFFIGDVHAKGKLESKVDGMQDAEVGLSLSGPLLTHRQQESLNPMVITFNLSKTCPIGPFPTINSNGYAIQCTHAFLFSTTHRPATGPVSRLRSKSTSALTRDTSF